MINTTDLQLSLLNFYAKEIRIQLLNLYPTLFEKTNDTQTKEKNATIGRLAFFEMNTLQDSIQLYSDFSSGNLSDSEGILQMHDLCEIFDDFILQSAKINKNNFDFKCQTNRNIEFKCNTFYVKHLIKVLSTEFLKNTGKNYFKSQLEFASFNNKTYLQFTAKFTGDFDFIQEIKQRQEMLQHSHIKFPGSIKDFFNLYIVKHLLKHLNAEIEFQYAANLAAIVQLSVPVQITPHKQVKKSDNALKDKKGPNILIVEDYELNQLTLKQILNKYAIYPDCVGNGKLAIKKLKEIKYDLIFMDIEMPVMNGFEATQYIRKHLKNQIPIIAVTANTSLKVREKCNRFLIDEFVPKPFHENEIISKIERLLQIHLVKQIGKPGPQKSDYEISPDVKLYSLKTLDSFYGDDDDEKTRMLNMFIELTPDLLTEMEKLIHVNNFAEAGKIAHKIKPSIDILEIVTLKKKIRAFESSCKNAGDKEFISSSFQDIKNILYLVFEQIKAEFK